MTDPIADYLTRLRNAIKAQHRVVEVPASNLKKEITKILFDSKEKIQYALPVDISLDETTAVEGITIPFHKGAAAYYEDCSVDPEDETEKGSK